MQEKLKNNISKIGYFWLPSDLDNKVAGILDIEESGKISLKVHGLLGINNFEQFRDVNNLEIILGDIDGEGKITLVDSCYSFGKRGGNIEVKSKNYIESDYIFIGTHFYTKDDIQINNFQFRVEGLNDWMGISGITINPDFDNPFISYSTPDKLLINIDDTFSLEVIYSGTRTMGFGLGANDYAEIHQDTYFKIQANENLPFSDFFNLGIKIANFLIFAIDKQVSIEKINVQQIGLNEVCVNGEEIDKQKSIKVFTNKILHIEKFDKASWNTMMFRYCDIDNFEHIIQIWLGMYNKIDPSLDLYFSVRFSKDNYFKSQFLMFTQALESLHSRLNPNNLNLLLRLEELSQDFVDMSIYTQEEVTEFILKIKDTRNYLTHYDKSKEDRAIEDSKYQEYINTMELLLQIHFLKLLGVGKDKILEFLKIK